MRTVHTRKSADTCGMPSAVSGLIRMGRARWSKWYGASKMCGVSVREYRSLTRAGSMLVSATSKA